MNKYQEKIKECLHKLAENTPGRYCTKEELNNLGKYVLEICDKADKYDDKETAMKVDESTLKEIDFTGEDYYYNDYYDCPKCKYRYITINSTYCENCGQRLDFGEVDE